MRRPAVFGPFRNLNFSFYFWGQVLSHTGTWFQNLALSLVILEATGSAQALSGVTVAQFLPMLLFSVPAGWIADRIRPRLVLMVTSLLSAAAVGLIALAVSQPDPVIWVLYALVGVLGSVSAFERIAAQAIIYEVSGPEELTRAASLSTIALASARSVGPGLAGLAFQGLGATACMLLNASSYLLVFASMLALRTGRMYQRRRTVVDKAAQIDRGALFRNRGFVTLLIVNVIIALLALNLNLVLTSTVTLTYGGDATAVGAVHALNAIGAIAGGILAAARTITVRSLGWATAGVGVAMLLNAAAPTLPIFLLLGPALGLAIGYYQGVLYAAAQASVPPDWIGRAMSFVTMGNYGMAPLGALLQGWIIDLSSGRVALAMGGIGGLISAVVVFTRMRRPAPSETDE